MSEQNFSGGGVATQEPPAEAPDAPVTGSRRNLIVVGIAVAVALLVAVYFLFLSGGSGTTPPSGAVPHASVQANAAGKSVTKKKVAVVKPAAPKDNTGVDPFKPLLTTPSPSVSTEASSAAAPPPSASAPAPSSSAAVGTPAAGNVVATLSLVSIDSKAKTATFSVASTGNPQKFAGVKVGGTFATFFKLFDLGAKCAQVQYGDITDSVCMGTPLVVSSAS